MFSCLTIVAHMMGLWGFTPCSIISSYDFSEKPAASIFRVKGRKNHRTEQCTSKTEEYFFEREKCLNCLSFGLTAAHPDVQTQHS
jgi:hypothetical protein